MIHPQFKPASDFPDCLRDESRRVGRADTISFPSSEEELVAHVRASSASKTPLTVQGGRTGITAGAVPDGGHIINLSRMNAISPTTIVSPGRTALVRIQPGALLSELRKHLTGKSPSFFFPPDPTETSATLGGMAACNASGACSFMYGPTRRHVEALRVVLADGDIVTLRRNDAKANGLNFSLRTVSGRDVSGTLPSYALPSVKNAAGYCVSPDMDLIDLFIGSEGTLGIISELTLRLSPAPHSIWGIMAFLPSEKESLNLVGNLRASVAPAAIEFFDSSALNLLRRMKDANPAFAALPALPSGNLTGIYSEFHGRNEADVESMVSIASDALEKQGGNPDNAWLVSAPADVERLKFFRHAVPEAVNLIIDERRRSEPSLTKLGTDLSVPDGRLEDVMAMYRRDLAGSALESVIFGHIGNNHVHVNIMPHTPADYEKGRALYAEWARTVVSWGGSVSAEHGIGKLKTAMLRIMYGDDGIRAMRDLKRIFDPDLRLNPGNLFGN